MLQPLPAGHDVGQVRRCTGSSPSSSIEGPGPLVQKSGSQHSHDCEARKIDEVARKYSNAVPPWPPCSLGIEIALNPSSPMRSKISRYGASSDSSHSRAASRNSAPAARARS